HRLLAEPVETEPAQRQFAAAPQPFLVSGNPLRYGPRFHRARNRSPIIVRSNPRRSAMRPLMLIIAASLIAGCTRPVSPPGASFEQETAGRIAGPVQNCVPTETAQGLRVIDSRTIGYGLEKTIYVSHLSAPCPGIEPISTLIVEPATAG